MTSEADAAPSFHGIDDAAVMDLLAAIEQRLPVAAWRVAEVQVWPALRLKLAADNARSFGYGRSGNADPPLRGRLAGAVADTLACLLPAQRPTPARAAFLGNGVSHTRVAGGCIDTLCDPLRLLLAERGWTTCGWSPDRFPNPSLLPWRSLADGLARARAGARWRRGSVQVETATAAGLAEARALVQERGGNPLCLEQWRVIPLACLLAALADTLAEELRRCRAEIAFVGNFTSLEGLALCLASRRIGIPSVDIQHGVQGALHHAYAAWLNLPASGYELLPLCFWCWCADDAEAIARWAHGSPHTAFAGGNLLTELCLAGRLAAPAVSRDQARGALRVLVSLQPGHARHALAGQVPACISALGERACWRLRGHPAMREEMAGIHTEMSRFPGAWTIEGPERPLAQVLLETDVHLTASSSVVIDAARFGIGSVSMDPLAAQLFPELARDGTLRFATSTDEAVQMLQAAGSRRTAPPPARLPDLDSFLATLVPAHG